MYISILVLYNLFRPFLDANKKQKGSRLTHRHVDTEMDKTSVGVKLVVIRTLLRLAANKSSKQHAQWGISLGCVEPVRRRALAEMKEANSNSGFCLLLLLCSFSLTIFLFLSVSSRRDP